MYRQELGERGKPAFYQGRVAQAIVDIINQNGGVMTLEDLSSHDSEVITPISTDYKVRSATIDACCGCILIMWSAEGMTPLCVQGVRLWEPPPNSQGLAALLLLNILENFPLKGIHWHADAAYQQRCISASYQRISNIDISRVMWMPIQSIKL